MDSMDFGAPFFSETIPSVIRNRYTPMSGDKRRLHPTAFPVRASGQTNHLLTSCSGRSIAEGADLFFPQRENSSSAKKDCR
jgi:hypothetical protein